MEIFTPFEDKTLKRLKAGMWVEITGRIYCARDASHKRLAGLIKEGKRLPINIKGETIYYTGPTPAPPGMAIGSCGPTTSSRMDGFVPYLLRQGLKGMIGKGKRGSEIAGMLKKYKAVYFVTFPGCGAYLSQFVKKSKIVAFPELGPEAIYLFEVEKFPAIVATDSSGKDIYRKEKK